MMSKTTNEEKLISYIFQNQNSFSEREGVFDLNFTSGRNYINTLEGKLDITFKREWEQTASGNSKYYRYSVADRKTAECLIKYANLKAQARGEVAFNEQAMKNILQQFN